MPTMPTNKNWTLRHPDGTWNAQCEWCAPFAKLTLRIEEGVRKDCDDIAELLQDKFRSNGSKFVHYKMSAYHGIEITFPGRDILWEDVQGAAALVSSLMWNVIASSTMLPPVAYGVVKIKEPSLVELMLLEIDSLEGRDW